VLDIDALYGQGDTTIGGRATDELGSGEDVEARAPVAMVWIGGAERRRERSVVCGARDGHAASRQIEQRGAVAAGDDRHGQATTRDSLRSFHVGRGQAEVPARW
jgi:hypothetical protein